MHSYLKFGYYTHLEYLMTWGLTIKIPFLTVSAAFNCQDLGRRVYGYYQENW